MKLVLHFVTSPTEFSLEAFETIEEVQAFISAINEERESKWLPGISFELNKAELEHARKKTGRDK